MVQETNNDAAACKSCGRRLDDGDKFGLCPDCANKFGTPLMGVGGVAAVVAVKKLGPKIVRLLFSLIKR